LRDHPDKRRHQQQRLWERDYQQLVRLAQARLRAAPRTVPADGEDVALDALDSVFLGALQGRFRLLAAGTTGPWEGPAAPRPAQLFLRQRGAARRGFGAKPLRG
jgi:hypothetical protein